MYTLPLHTEPPTGLDLLQVILAFASWAAVVALAVLPVLAPARWPAQRLRRLYRAYPLLLLVALVAWRAPNFIYNAEHDVDESAFLATAHQFEIDPVPWRSVDTQTSGPLNAYLLEWAPLAGFPLDYRVVALTGLPCIFLTMLLQLKSTALILGRRRSLLLMACAATFYFFAWHFDEERYTSEYLPVLLMTTAGWLMLTLRRRPTWIKALAIGILLGAVPFAKLQGAPVAVYLFAVAAALLLTSGAERFTSARERIWSGAALVAGGLAVPLLIMGPVIATGAWPEFFQRYILNGLHYQRSLLFSSEPSYLSHIFWCLKVDPFIVVLLLFCAFLAVVKFTTRAGSAGRAWLAGWALLAGYVCVSAFVILKPKLQFHHYHLLLITPLVLLVAWSIRGASGMVRPGILPRNSAALLTVLLVLCVVPLLFNYGLHFYEHPRLSDRPPASQSASALTALSRPGDTMAVWGWTPDLYVRTGLAPATHELNGFYIISPGPEYDSFRDSFIADMEKAKPRFFVDSAAVNNYPDGWPHPAEKARYTNFPVVAAYIDAHYHLQLEAYPAVETDPPTFIYVRNDEAR